MDLILGIDPGTTVTGYGLIRKEGSRLTLVDFGVIRPPRNLELNERYATLYDGMTLLIEKYQPSAVSIETQFVLKNAQSAIKLGMARGVLIVAAVKKGVPVYEYAPRKAKSALTGNGGASKEQVQKMLQLLFQLESIPTPEDAADALALAVCHANQSQLLLTS